jgi:hypothetical protein
MKNHAMTASTRPLKTLALFLLLAIAAGSWGGCAHLNQQYAGPESSDLASRLHGTLAFRKPDFGKARLMTFPGMAERGLFPPGAEPHLWLLAGPDAQNRLVYVTYDLVSTKIFNVHEKISLKVISAEDGQSRTLFERMGDNLIGKQVALSARGGQVAFVGNTKWDGSSGVSIGELEIWDVETGRGGPIGIKALPEGISWFSDGSRLAFVEVVRREDVAPALWSEGVSRASKEALVHSPEEGGGFADEFQKKKWWKSGWAAADKVPVVWLYDRATKTVTPLHVGLRPVVSPDGSTVLLQDSKWRFMKIDLATGKNELVGWPEYSRPFPIALLDEGYLLYASLPSQGVKKRSTEHNSPMVGPKPMVSVKIWKIGTTQYQTLVSYVDPRDVRKMSVSYSEPAGPRLEGEESGK